MNNTINSAKRHDGKKDRKETSEAVGFTWIEDAYDRATPAMLGSMTLDEQNETVMGLAKKAEATLRVILTYVAPHDDDTGDRIEWIVSAVERYRPRFVATPRRTWISQSDDDVRLLERLLKQHDATLITND